MTVIIFFHEPLGGLRTRGWRVNHVLPTLCRHHHQIRARRVVLQQGVLLGRRGCWEHGPSTHICGFFIWWYQVFSWLSNKCGRRISLIQAERLHSNDGLQLLTWVRSELSLGCLHDLRAHITQSFDISMQHSRLIIGVLRILKCKLKLLIYILIRDVPNTY